ncbi:MAG TPA: type II secretion system protein [Gemmatimonadales bacterium]|nr:type II secretion system protein [Gemmatimonadales bacterium]
MTAGQHDNPMTRLRSRHGFTLIELLIVVVIIGLLAAIGIPKFAATKEKAFVAKMKSDLKNLATAQEAYAADYSTGYYGGAVPNALLTYNPSSGVTITITEVVPGGWAATAAYPAGTTRTCALFSGPATPPPPATSEGQIACTP